MSAKRAALIGVLAIFVLALANASQGAWAGGGALPNIAPVRDGANGPWFRGVCLAPGRQDASCGAQVISNSSGVPLSSPSPPLGSYGPTEFHTGYSLPTSTHNAETIGIVDAYDDPSIESDLAVYDTYYGLPACTTANGCFEKVNQAGNQGPYPTQTDWHLEIALDVETAHEICQNCKILLVEANSASLNDLAASVDEAVTLGATVVSNSYGAAEFSSEASYDSHFNHPGVPIVVASGDDAYNALDVDYPAASPYVTAVGGTRLLLNGDDTYKSESVWLTNSTEGTGSGCSRFETKPSWQTDTGCTKRMVGDVSADADPATGAAVVDSLSGSGSNIWLQVGGTSLASPLIAGVYALTGSTQGGTYGQTPYLNSGSLHDVTTGSNGSCTPSFPAYVCTAETGYDGPTGLGSPNGIAGFAAPGFTLGVTPSGQTIPTGTSNTYAVAVNDVAGFSGAADLTASGLPSGVTPAFSPSTTTTASTLTVSVGAGAAPGTYPFTISGKSGVVTASIAASLVVIAPPGPPTGVSAVASDSAATVSWTAPSSTGGSPITGYTVTAAPGGATATAGPSATSALVTGLVDGTTYTFTVKATNAAGQSAASAPSNPAIPPAPPGQPTGVSAVGGDITATVTWTAPASDGGSPITGYTVTVAPGGATATAGPSATSATVSGLVDGTPYTFTVKATNLIGTGSASLPSNTVIPSTMPGPPTGVSALAGNGSATVSWTAPTTIGASPITGYTITVSPGGATATAPGGSTSATVSGLVNGTAYTFTVDASNGSGSGTASVPSSAVTPAAPPSGGGGGGGGGSSTVSITVDPKAQTISSGGSAQFTITVTNTGGAYVSAADVADGQAPSCNRSGSDIADLAFFAPGETLSWSCSVTGVSASFTNTPTVSAVTAPGPVITASDSAQVTVSSPPAVSFAQTAPKATTPKTAVPKRTTTSSKGITRVGNAKANTLIGTARNDILKGEGGNDLIEGKGGNDILIGGPGNDTIWGGPGNDTISGGPGNDTIHAADGSHDTIDCGAGHDVVYADKHDTVAKNCEVVHIS